MNEDNQAARTLSDRLREASIDRARRRGDVVDDRVLDATGVIDLRDEWPEAPPSGLAAALAAAESPMTLFHRVSPTHRPGRSRPPLQPTSRPAEPAGADARDSDDQPAGLPTRTAGASAFEASATTPSPSLAQAFLSIEVDSLRERHGDDEVDLRGPTSEDTTDGDGRPVAPCPSCGGTGRRDLFDRFSQTDYFSCDDCSTMWQVSRD